MLPLHPPRRVQAILTACLARPESRRRPVLTRTKAPVSLQGSARADAGQRPAYLCYCSPDRTRRNARGANAHAAKSRVTTAAGGLSPGKTLPCPPACNRWCDFKNPPRARLAVEGSGQGHHRIRQRRTRRPSSSRAANGTPTYNFCVVVDDLDIAESPMSSAATTRQQTTRARSTSSGRWAPKSPANTPTSVDDPRTHPAPSCPNVTDAVSVNAVFRGKAICREAVINYLARLGWSHGDAELFNASSFVAVVRPRPHHAVGPRQFNTEKLRWINQQYIKAAGRCAAGRARAPLPRAQHPAPNPATTPRAPTSPPGCVLVKGARRPLSRSWPHAATLCYYRTLHPHARTAGAARHPRSAARRWPTSLGRLETLTWERSRHQRPRSRRRSPRTASRCRSWRCRVRVLW